VRRRWPLLLLAPAAVWAGLRAADDGGPSEAQAPPASAPPVSTLVAFQAPVGERTTGARCWMVVVDESSSMTEADSQGTRADAIRATAEFLTAYGVEGDRIGVTWFAERAEVTPAVPSGEFVVGASRLDVGSGTRIASALRDTVDSMAGACGTAQRVVVLVTDGQETSDPSFTELTQVLTGSSRDVHVHLVAMNGNQAFEPVRAFWQDSALGIDSITTVSTFGSDEVAAAVAGILTAETGQRVAPR
jgi:hypothetical protein